MFKNLISQNNNFLNFILFLIPLAFIIGNFAINLLILILILFSIFIQKKNILMKENINFIVMFLFFFVLIIFSTLIEYFNNKNYDDIDKSFFFIKVLFINFYFK